QKDLDAQIRRDWKKRSLCYREGAGRPYQICYSVSFERIIFLLSRASKNRIVVLFGSCGSSTPIGRLYFTDGSEYIRSSLVASLGLIPINRVRLSFILSTIFLANRSHSLQHLPV
ncbi:1119_t:CDS:2, partial [Acaulospora morrowiae]